MPITPLGPGMNPNPLMMPLPTVWPAVDRSPGTTGGNPLEWRFTEDYPISNSHRAWADDNDNRGDPLTLPTQRWNQTSNGGDGAWLNNQYDKWATADLGRPNERSRFLIHWMMHANANDQLRQKMGYALQQICVVANSLTIIQDRDMGMANYQDQVNRMAFDKYRNIIDFIMISPQMGWWLSSFNNQKAADISVPLDGIIDVFPDENLAREVMQLFTCGLFMLHPDGSLALNADSGLPDASYNNDDITELSRIITGHGYDKYVTGNGLTTRHTNFDNPTTNDSFTRNADDSRMGHTFNYPMKMFGDFHDTAPKTILGGKDINNTGLAADPMNPNTAEATAIGNADMKDALDWLAGVLDAGLRPGLPKQCRQCRFQPPVHRPLHREAPHSTLRNQQPLLRLCRARCPGLPRRLWRPRRRGRPPQRHQGHPSRLRSPRPGRRRHDGTQKIPLRDLRPHHSSLRRSLQHPHQTPRWIGARFLRRLRQLRCWNEPRSLPSELRIPSQPDRQLPPSIPNTVSTRLT